MEVQLVKKKVHSGYYLPVKESSRKFPISLMSKSGKISWLLLGELKSTLERKELIPDKTIVDVLTEVVSRPVIQML